MLRNKQSGSALLAFLLILVTSASYILVKELNANIRRENSGTNTAKSLNEAKNAILGWAISNPVYPGSLPMPDRNGDSEYDGESDCYTAGPIGNNLLLGKLPWKDVGSGCIDGGNLAGLQIYAGLSDNPSTATVNELWTDSAGKVFWYAASHNLVYETPAYPQISLALLETEANWITVRDENGCIISDRVAFVVIAPGTAILNQDRSSGAPAASNYLDSITTSGSYTCPDSTVIADGTTFSNSDTDQDFVSYRGFRITTDASESYNDQLVFVTIDELMDALKKRVLSEAGNILSAYHNNYGALPWLTPYFDPKADNRILYGTHTGSDNATSLTDSTTDFGKWGVKKGDIVRNVTDGSLSIVTVDNATTALTVTGIHLGTDNDFDTDDEYYIVPRDLGDKLDDKADSSSSGSSLVDGGQEFAKMDVVPGDIIDNVTDGSSGVVDTVSDTTITVRNMTGGTDNDFDDNDEYQVRSYAGKATNATNNTLTLDDSQKNFTAMGAAIGDVIVNLKDGSMGRISTVAQTSLTADSLKYGRENDFDDNDTYILPRFVGKEGTREGLLSFHRPGGFFPSTFDIDWNIPEIAGGSPNAIVSIDTPGTHTDYINTLKQIVQTSSGTSGTISVEIEDGTCVWTKPEIVECSGSHTKYDPVQGQLTSGSNTVVVTDSTQDFIISGVNPGDIVQNYDDESFVTSGTATAGSNGTILMDSGASFSAYDPTGLYNYLVRNTSYAGPNKAQGILAEIDGNTTLTVNDYSGWGVDPITFTSGDNYSFYTPFKSVVSADVSAITSTSLRTNRLTGSAPDFDNLEFYRIKAATGKITGTVDSNGGSTLTDSSQDFVTAGVQIGDVVHNITDSAWGEITSVSATSLTATLRIDNGNTRVFNTGESYEVYYAYMNSRRYEFTIRFSGTA
ncbi:MAG: hypothetical protein HN764_00525, partial [Gammaproteobacteria bacterium]|nr:hypothetical protein [Gammaproteobacteria bacterium]